MISPFLRFVLQLGFGICTFGGTAGLMVLWIHHNRLDDLQTRLAWAFCILLGALIIVGTIGIVHVRRISTDLSVDADLSQLGQGKPLNNIFAGLLILGIAVALTASTSLQRIWYGGMVCGSFQAMFGASQLALEKKRNKLERRS